MWHSLHVGFPCWKSAHQPCGEIRYGASIEGVPCFQCQVEELGLGILREDPDCRPSSINPSIIVRAQAVAVADHNWELGTQCRLHHTGEWSSPERLKVLQE
ncbi:unnamed protein product [Linum tenue]|uniref:Uncharacterized protein n=1 Tax=Linum tenue TaxID=586396 RepID=A0AAV0MVP7_9ROSI|nr:unnamed protein product [Linum tenue]